MLVCGLFPSSLSTFGCCLAFVVVVCCALSKFGAVGCLLMILCWLLFLPVVCCPCLLLCASGVSCFVSLVGVCRSLVLMVSFVVFCCLSSVVDCVMLLGINVLLAAIV